MSTSSDGSPLLHNSYKEGREMAQLRGTEANGEIEVSKNSPLEFNPRRDEPSIQFGGLDDHDLDDEDEDFIEIEPLISYQSYNSRSHLSRSASTDSSYMTNNHCHEAKPIHSNKRARRKLTIASVVCLLFVVAEVIGGYLAGSLAVMTDAAHMLSDFAAFLISLFALWVAKWRPDKRRTFGYYRAEVLGALVSVLIIWVLTGILVYLAVQRTITKDFSIDADVMLITAGLGLMVNILLGIILHQTGMGHGHSHGGGGSHSHGGGGSHAHGGGQGGSHSRRGGHHEESLSLSRKETTRKISLTQSLNTTRATRKGSSKERANINVRAAFIHVLGDIVQSVGVLIAAYVIKYKPEWKLADPVCTFVFSVLVLFTTINILKDTVHVLMEGTPKDINYNLVKKALESIEGVKVVHSLHIWSLTMNKAALSVHLAIEPGVDSQKVLNIASRKVTTDFMIYHTTIQVELYQTRMSNCKECKDLKD